MPWAPCLKHYGGGILTAVDARPEDVHVAGGVHLCIQPHGRCPVQQVGAGAAGGGMEWWKWGTNWGVWPAGVPALQRQGRGAQRCTPKRGPP